MPFVAREMFHHPDPSRNLEYQRGQKIDPADEAELDADGYLSRYCTRTAAIEQPNQQPTPSQNY